MSKYSLVNAMLSALDPITERKKSDVFKPNRVTKIEIKTAKTIDWDTYKEATLTFFDPIELPIKEFVEAPTPTPIAIIIKYSGNDLAIALMASGDIFPANQVSTRL